MTKRRVVPLIAACSLGLGPLVQLTGRQLAADRAIQRPGLGRLGSDGCLRRRRWRRSRLAPTLRPATLTPATLAAATLAGLTPAIIAPATVTTPALTTSFAATVATAFTATLAATFRPRRRFDLLTILRTIVTTLVRRSGLWTALRHVLLPAFGRGSALVGPILATSTATTPPTATATTATATLTLFAGTLRCGPAIFACRLAR
ncbi:MAG: hypothetical protein WCK33_13750, partial [Phycisphaerae bacterium]